MKRGLMSIAWLLLLSLSLLPQVSDGATIEDLQQRVDALEEEIATHRSEDWNLFCFRMLDTFGTPFVDVLTMRLVRPNPPEWNLDAQAELNGANTYVLPGGGDVRTDLHEKIYAFHLTLHNTSIHFGGQPVVSMRGILGGPWTLEARGKLNVAPFVSHGSKIENVPCETEEEQVAAAARQAAPHLMGDQEP